MVRLLPLCSVFTLSTITVAINIKHRPEDNHTVTEFFLFGRNSPLHMENSSSQILQEIRNLRLYFIMKGDIIEDQKYRVSEQSSCGNGDNTLPRHKHLPTGQ